MLEDLNYIFMFWKNLRVWKAVCPSVWSEELEKVDLVDLTRGPGLPTWPGVPRLP